MAGVEETLHILRESINEAQEQQTKHAGEKVRTFAVGVKVWLSTRNLKASRPSKKLNYKCAELYTVSNIIKKNAYKLHLTSALWNDNVFNVSLLDRYTLPYGHQPSTEPHPGIVEETE
jgi:hypothetical protein